jgi:hypothetical protein
MDDDDLPDDDPRAKDLVRQRLITPPDPAGWRTHLRLWAREARRPVGSSARTWLRVAGEDPFHLADGVALMRRTTYVDGRLVRVDQEYKDARREPGAKPTPPSAWDKAGPDGFGSVPTASRGGNRGEDLLPPGFRNVPAAPSNKGEELLPPGFRNLPAAKPSGDGQRAANVGESLIPEHFRNLPVAKPPEPPRPLPTPTPRAPEPVRETRPGGRMPVDQGRRRVPILGPVITQHPAQNLPAATATPSPATATPPPATATPPAPVEAPAPAAAPIEGPVDLFAAPLQGRTRLARRPPPEPDKKG